ncbi:NUDIX domain-containing protein [Streptomyces sp. NBC_01497]|uniref:NUDIX domain-containing protein n=1 Tax=Streptomyces sp. NBC_01497 TaxID=2903885 RepID=UPI002E345C6C|nr:NUDIX domain-containing protein [Streptomyces sp. NBC_01497]
MPRSDRFTKTPEPGSHCASCGTSYPTGVGWPRECSACGTTAYRNPLPVAVALLPVTDEQGSALITIRRTIEPQSGGMALPGGFIDADETWQHAVVRELAEETGIEAAEEDVRLADALSSTDGHLLLFGLLPARRADLLPPSRPTAETSGTHLLHEPRDLAFPLHTTAVRNWFAGHYHLPAL